MSRTIRPDHAPALSQLAAVLLGKSEAAEAVAVLQRAVAAEPGAARAHSNLGSALRECG